jgi:hypothetical protein
MGHNWIQLAQPHHGGDGDVRAVEVDGHLAVDVDVGDGAGGQAVAVQVDPFGKQTLKPGFHFIGSRAETRRFQAMGSTGVNGCTSPHHAALGVVRKVGVKRDAHRALLLGEELDGAAGCEGQSLTHSRVSLD